MLLVLSILTLKLFQQELLQIIVQNAGEIFALHVPWYKQLMIALWVLATPDSFRSIGKSTLYFGIAFALSYRN